MDDSLVCAALVSQMLLAGEPGRGAAGDGEPQCGEPGRGSKQALPRWGRWTRRRAWGLVPEAAVTHLLSIYHGSWQDPEVPLNQSWSPATLGRSLTSLCRSGGAEVGNCLRSPSCKGQRPGLTQVLVLLGTAPLESPRRALLGRPRETQSTGSKAWRKEGKWGSSWTLQELS